MGAAGCQNICDTIPEATRQKLSEGDLSPFQEDEKVQRKNQAGEKYEEEVNLDVLRVN